MNKTEIIQKFQKHFPIYEKVLWEVLVPVCMGDPPVKIELAYHQEWDKQVREIARGLTVCYTSSNDLSLENAVFVEKTIPVNIRCNLDEMLKIIDITLSHYQQQAIMVNVASPLSFIVER